MTQQKNGRKYIHDCAQLMAEWNQEKNSALGLDPKEITCGSSKVKVWWICEKGHEWLAKPNNRTSGKGCPYCSGRKVSRGENDLETKYPELIEEWDYETNAPVLPSEIMPKTNKTYWWVCKICGNKWSATPNSRTSGAGCPRCAKRFHSSFPEQAIFYYVSKAYPDAINSYKDIFSNNMELDIYIPSLNMGIEYDGEHAHRETRWKKDRKKYNLCRKYGITLIRIREEMYNLDEPICDFQIRSRYTSGNYYPLDAVLDELSSFLPLISDHNVDADSIGILEVLKRKLHERSLAEKHPELAEQWNYLRNGILSPDMFLSGNGEKVWWKCDKGHEWKAHIYSRSTGVGCPVCANKQILIGYNDLATTNPEVVCEWDFAKNGTITPKSVPQSVSKKVWWRCEKGHSYQMRVDHRTSGHGCPYCAGSKAIPGENDIATLYPNLLEEWNYEKNEGISPSEYLAGSEKKVWWKCATCGNVWESIIANRTKGTGCPECGKKLAVHRSLLSKLRKGNSFEQWCNVTEGKQHLLLEWSDRNTIHPSEVSPKSYQKVFWKCSVCGYEWTSEVYKRSNHKNTCRVCLNRLVLIGHNDLGTISPEIIDEWDHDKNGTLQPSQIVACSSKSVWWIGKCRHSWQARVSDRALKKWGCPFCSSSRVLEGLNDLDSQNPQLAEEWCFERNDLTPKQVTKNSHKNVWWKCQACGGEWQATVKSRNQGSGCPTCSGASKKRIINTDTGEIFDSLTAAAKRYDRYISPIAYCCKGKQETAYGFHWRYYDSTAIDNSDIMKS